MAFSNLIALSIIVTVAATLHAAGKTDIQTSADAAEALRPIAGVFAEVIFALGIVGTGLLAIPVLAGATAYAVGEGRRWPVGLARKPKEAAAFYAVLALSAGIGIALNFTSINPISALYWSAVINGVLAVPVMVLLMFMARRRDVMGSFVVRRPALLAGLAVDAGDAAQRRGDGRGVFCREVMGAGRLSKRTAQMPGGPNSARNFARAPAAFRTSWSIAIHSPSAMRIGLKDRLPPTSP